MNNLRKKLQYSNAIAFDGANLINRIEIDKEITQLEKIVKNGGREYVAKDRIIEALLTFFKNQSIQNISQARLICYGIVQKIDQKISLIENRKLLIELINYVKNFKDKPRPFRRCYKGLLSNYFIFNPKDKNISEENKKGWDDLKEFLYDHRNRLSTNELNPEWVETLIKHENLLQDNPCAKYGFEALNGDRSVFDEIRNKLEIQDDSWVVKELVNAQVDSAIKLKDQEFKETITNLLDLLNEHDFVNECLGKIINRYTQCSDKSVNYLLRDFSVARWKNPWLKGNDFRWATVSEEGKQMVTTWLKLHLINEFFGFLSEDGSNDTRRVNFWKSYHKDIDDMYFALGSDAYNSNNQNLRQIRQAMEGRLKLLSRAGNSSNNAFIMKIKEYYFIEFGQAGNAAFVFDMNKKLPFNLSHSELYGDHSELKNKDSVSFKARLVHRDSNYGRWEDEFEKFLKLYLGIKKETNNLLLVGGTRGQRNLPLTAITSPNTQTRSTNQDPPSRVIPQNSQTRIFEEKKSAESFENEVFSITSIRLLASQNNLLVRDHRNSGGHIWLESPNGTFDTWIVQKLESWNFEWSDRRKAYFK